jgi:hypothetical protein
MVSIVVRQEALGTYSSVADGIIIRLTDVPVSLIHSQAFNSSLNSHAPTGPRPVTTTEFPIDATRTPETYRDG